MKLLLVGAFLMVIVQSFFQEVDINAEVNDYYFMEANMKPWFGKKHLQKNDEISTVSEVQPLIWGEQNRIIVMFDVNYNAPQPAASSRSVIFVVDTGSPSTYISELTLKKITKDCEIDIDVPGKIPIEINGIPISARVSKDVNFETNVIGMDFLLSNNVQFVMKLNSEDRKKSSVSLKFGSTSQKDKKQIKQKSKGKKKSKKQK